MDSLKQVLENKPEIPAVYFNEKGEWLFFPNPNFPKKLDRETILAAKTVTELSEVVGVDLKSKLQDIETPGQVIDGLLLKSQDAEDFELEKSIFEEEKATFQVEKETFEADKLANSELLIKSTADLSVAKKELADSKKSISDRDREIKDLQGKIAILEKDKKGFDDLNK